MLATYAPKPHFVNIKMGTLVVWSFFIPNFMLFQMALSRKL